MICDIKFLLQKSIIMNELPKEILVVDDDRKLRSLLLDFLTQQNLKATSTESAESAYKLIIENNYSLLILDVMMQGMSGYELAKKLRQENINIPILMLTAKGDVEERIIGLESGADDYLPKPFEPRELYLRIIKLLNRPSNSIKTSNQYLIKFGEFEFNLENNLLTKNSTRIPLSSSEAELLAIFCQNINIPIERIELSKRFNGISERSVDVQVTRLRKKIELDPKVPLFIQTSRGKGYVFRTYL